MRPKEPGIVMPVERSFGVEVRHLAALAAIDSERSFRGAAESLGYVQSAVSQQISTLERLIGTRLVERSSGHATVRLTTAGELLAERAHRILAQLNAACTDVRALGDHTDAPVRCGASQSLAASIVPGMLSILARRSSTVAVSISESVDDRGLFKRLRTGALDIILTELPLPDAGFASRRLALDPTVLLRPIDGPPFLTARPPSLSELDRHTLIRNRTWRMSELIEAELAAAGAMPRLAMDSNTDAGVQALVAAGLGFALMPALAVNWADPRVGIVRLDGVLPSRVVVASWLAERDVSPALIAVDAARAACAEVLTAPSADVPRHVPVAA